MKLCVVCGWDKRRVRERCQCCYVYFRKYGRDRTEALLVREGLLMMERPDRGRAKRPRKPKPAHA